MKSELPTKFAKACGAKSWLSVLLWLAVLFASGCYAPLHSNGIPAATLSEDYRMPWRTAGVPLNFASLTLPPQPDYVLGSNDTLEVMVHRLNPDGTAAVVRVQVLSNGQVQLPIVGGVQVGGLTLSDAQVAITKAYTDDVQKNPRVSVFLIERSTTGVLVLGAVKAPGAYRLPKLENDVAHALGAAGGLADTAGMEIQVHRRLPPAANQPSVLPNPPADVPVPMWSPEEISPLPSIIGSGVGPSVCVDPSLRILRIPLRGFQEQPLQPSDVMLQQGDVVVVPNRRDEVFFVVGKLSPANAVRFSVGRDERELGSGYILPRDREIDVVTAVCMAGYIDPIDSPTTVTVHRMGPDGKPILILVDLIKARYDFRENLLVAPGDIIYLNPDAAWWSRRTFDRIIPSLFSLSYRKLLHLGGVGSDN